MSYIRGAESPATNIDQPALQSCLSDLNYAIEQFDRVQNRIDGAADRLMGGEPKTASNDKAAGMAVVIDGQISELRRIITRLSNIATECSHHLDRLDRAV